MAANPFHGLDPDFAARLQALIAASNGLVSTGSGYRSIAEQQDLYDRWLRGELKDTPKVAIPGHSQHNFGLAMDLKFASDAGQKWAHQHAAEFGLYFPMDDEPWHVQPMGAGHDVPDTGQWADMGIQYNLNYVGTGRQANPQDVLANRMHAMMSILGNTDTGMSIVAGPDGEATNVLAQAAPINTVIPEQGIPEAGEHLTDPLAAMPQPVGQFNQPNITGSSLEDMGVDFGKGGDKAQLVEYAKSLFAKFGWDESQLPALVQLWNKESGWDPLAQNQTSSAFGIAQFLDDTWGGVGIPKTTNPLQQILGGEMYIAARYGNPQNALAFHNQHNFY